MVSLSRATCTQRADPGRARIVWEYLSPQRAKRILLSLYASSVVLLETGGGYDEEKETRKGESLIKGRTFQRDTGKTRSRVGRYAS